MYAFDKPELIMLSVLPIIPYPKCKAVANGPVGQVLAGPLFLKVKTKFHFTESK